MSLRKNQGGSLRVVHARNLLVRLEHEIYAREWATSASIHALLLRECNHLTAALAQAGIEILRAALDNRVVPGKQLLDYLQRMSRLDRPHRQSLITELAWEKARQGDEKAENPIDTELKYCTANGACGTPH